MKAHIQNLFITLALLAASTSTHADTVYVANAGTNHIMQFTSGGIGSIFANTSSAPYGLAFDSEGNLYVANNGAGGIVKITPGGVGSSFANIGATPIGVAFDSAGNLYATYNQINIIEKFSSTGTDLGVFATTGLISPMLIAIKFDPTMLNIASSGNQYVLFWPASGTNFILQS